MPKQQAKEKKTATKSTTKRHNLHNVHGANGFTAHLGSHSHRSRSKKTPFDNLNPSVALGIIAMGLAGAATFAMFNTKKHTKTLRGNIYRRYRDLKDEASDYAHDAFEKGRKVYDSASDYAEGIREAAHDAMEQPYSGSLLLAGALGGTALGAASIYLINRYQTSDHSHEFLDKMMDIFGSVKEAAKSMTGNSRSNNWLDTAKHFMESVREGIDSHHDEEEEEEHPRHHSSPLKDALHLGFAGLRLWENMMHRKR